MEENRITTTELAEKLGVTHTAVSMMRSGKNQMRAKTLERLLQLYPDLCPRWLILGEGQSHCTARSAGSLIQDHAKYIHSMEEVISAKDEIIDLLKDKVKEMSTWRIAPVVATVDSNHAIKK